MGVNKIVVEAWLKENGFSLLCERRFSETVEFVYVDENGVNISIDFNTGEFYMSWVIPRSTFTIESGKAAPVWNLNHLDKMCRKFRKEVRVHGK